MFISGRKSQTQRNKAKGEMHTMNSIELPINILVNAISLTEIGDDDDNKLPLADDAPARQAAAWRIFIAVIIVVVVTTIITIPDMPAPYTKLSR